MKDRHELVIVRGVVPSPAERQKVTLVDSHVIELPQLRVGSCGVQIVWMRFVQHLLATEPSSVGRHNEDVACWQACGRTA